MPGISIAHSSARIHLSVANLTKSKLRAKHGQPAYASLFARPAKILIAFARPLLTPGMLGEAPGGTPA
jgi:hypothetical protein